MYHIIKDTRNTTKYNFYNNFKTTNITSYNI